MLNRHAVLAKIQDALAEVSDFDAACEKVVTLLHDMLPTYTGVYIYMLDGDTLVLTHFVGRPTEHTRIPIDRGICGAAVREAATVIVDDVRRDPRYIACSLETQSEIVVPIFKNGQVIGEIDVDSDALAAFTLEDREMLEKVAAWMAEKWRPPPR
ncbi:MAG: GAF domain-containing protein [Abditibacteriales bacterium]|nr:GAF domain-containing protein [Abditibacteriales bacterium]MDW8366043.1 GAF domain-containing protein [Abditibacteriales bacterium]